MIFLGETSDPAREIAFHLPSTGNPLVGITGHAFATGEVKIRLPGGAYANADVTRVVEKGFGDYALQLTDAQVAVKGKVYLYVNVSGAQVWTSDEEIVYTANLTGTSGAILPAAGAFTWQSLIDRARVYVDDDHDDQKAWIKPAMWMIFAQLEYNNLRRNWIRAGLLKPALTSTSFTGPTTTLTGVQIIAGVGEDLGNGCEPRWVPYVDTLWPTTRASRASSWSSAGFGTSQVVTLNPPDTSATYIVKWAPAIGYVTDPTLSVDLPPGGDERMVLGMAKRALVKDSGRSGAIEALILEQDIQLGFAAAANPRGDGQRAHRAPQWAKHARDYDNTRNPLHWRFF